jgi:molybdopterin-containing oxidoreductase family membrane subunit
MDDRGKSYVLGVFPDENKTASAIEALEISPWILDRVHSPFPSHKIMNALKLKKSGVGYFTLVGGILGFLMGFFLSIYTAGQWNLIVGGKPIISYYPFFIVGFEFTILFAVFGNILGFLIQSGLPEFKSLKQYDPRCSGDYFGILASCDKDDQPGLIAFFQEKGGEVKSI